MKKATKNILAILLAMLVIAVVCVGVLAMQIFHTQSRNTLTTAVINNTNLPVAKVGSQYIALKTYYTNLDSIQKQKEINDALGLDSFKAFSKQEKVTKEVVLNALIEFTAQKILANNRGLSEQEIQNKVELEFQEIVENQGENANVEAYLQEVYGLTIQEFKENVLAPIVLEELLLEEFVSEDEMLMEISAITSNTTIYFTDLSWDTQAETIVSSQ